MELLHEEAPYDVETNEEKEQERQRSEWVERHIKLVHQENQVNEEMQQPAHKLHHLETETQVEEEMQQPVYKLHHLDTETLMKVEIKQLIMTKVSQETSTKALNDMTYEIEEQLSNLKAQEHQLLTKHKNLNKEVETDSSRMSQSKEILFKTDEMIALLKENVEKLTKRFKESRIKDLFEKSKRQYKNLESLRNLYESKLETKKKNIKHIATSNELNLRLTSELKYRHEKLEDLRKKHDEIKKITISYDNEVENNLIKKHILEQKLADLNNRKSLNDNIAENELTKHEEQYQILHLKKENRIDKFSNLNKQQLELEQQLEDCVREVDSIKIEVTEVEEENAQKEVYLKTLKEQLEVTSNRCQETLKQLRQGYDDTCYKLEELTSNISVLNEKNCELHNAGNLSKIKVSYIQNCEKTLELIDITLKQQSAVHKSEMEFVKEKMENISKRTKLEELQNRSGDFLVSLKSVDEEILKEQEKMIKELADVKATYKLSETQHSKCFLDMKKKKVYSLATSEYLKEKSESLRQEAIEYENSYKNLQEENLTLNVLIGTKMNLLIEFKSKLEVLKRKNKVIPIKSGLKLPGKGNVEKKVQFNDVLSFKSTTESTETSSQPQELENQLESSFHEWLQNIKFQADPNSDAKEKSSV